MNHVSKFFAACVLGLGLTSVAAAQSNPDLYYEEATGNVKIYADGAEIISFALQSGGDFIPPADFTDLDTDVGFPSATTDNTTNTIGWVSALAASNVGFDGPAGSVNTPYADLGNVFPSGLDEPGLVSLLTANSWAPPGGGGGNFDLVHIPDAVPEPGSLVLALLGLVSLVAVGRKLRK